MDRRVRGNRRRGIQRAALLPSPTRGITNPYIPYLTILQWFTDRRDEVVGAAKYLGESSPRVASPNLRSAVLGAVDVRSLSSRLDHLESEMRRVARLVERGELYRTEALIFVLWLKTLSETASSEFDAGEGVIAESPERLFADRTSVSVEKLRPVAYNPEEFIREWF